MKELRSSLMLHVGGSFIEHACYHQLTNAEIRATLEDLLISHSKVSKYRLKEIAEKIKTAKKQDKKKKKILQFPEVWNG